MPFSAGIAAVIIAVLFETYKVKSSSGDVGIKGDLSGVVVIAGMIVLFVSLCGAAAGFGLIWRKLAQLLGRDGTSVAWWVFFALLLFAGFALSVAAGRYVFGAICFAGLELCEAFLWQEIGTSLSKSMGMKIRAN